MTQTHPTFVSLTPSDLSALEHPPRVLVVDDDEISLEAISYGLRGLGLAVEPCSDPGSAVALAEQCQPEIALVDVNMPTMNGLELAARIAATDTRGTPTILMTSDTGLDLGADSLAFSPILAVMYKPLPFEEVVDLVLSAREHRTLAEFRSAISSNRVGHTHLLIDPDATSRRQLHDLLTEAPLMPPHITDATSLGEAVALLARERFTHILVRAGLDGSTTEDTVLRLRSLAPNAVIIAILDDQSGDEASQAMRSGADEWVIRDHVDGLTFGKLLEYAAQRKRSHERLLYAYQHDRITKLMSAELFRDRLARAIAKQHQSGGELALLFVQLQGFSSISAMLGGRRARALLSTLADVLRRRFGPDKLGYLGTECFAVMLQNVGQDARQSFVEGLLGELQIVAQLKTHGLHTEFNAGLVSLGNKRIGAASALTAAQDALDQARRAHTPFCIFDEALARQVARRQVLGTDLRKALSRGELSLHYQPKIDFQTGEVNGTEALMRWKRRGKEDVSPGEFIPLLEQSGQIIEFGYWAIHTACAQLNQWTSEHGRMCRVAVNLSSRQFRDLDLVANIRRTIEELKVPPSCLQLEVTESTLIEDVDTCLETLRAIKALGVSLAMDDFGTGYSSMNYLKRFPFDFLKLDRSFILDLEVSQTSRAVVSGIVQLGHALGMRVIAEGIETENQGVILKAIGCDEAQGFFYGRPAPADALDWEPRQVDY